MPEQNKPFVVTDRRKFSLDGTPRPDADREPQSESQYGNQAGNQAELKLDTTSRPAPPYSPAPDLGPTASSHHSSEPLAAEPESEFEREPDFDSDSDSDVPPPPTQAEMDQANAAYQQTSDRLDTAVRAANPGMDHPPAMSFEAIVQSVFMTSLLQLGATAPEGQQPRIDLMGARQSIDMLAILAEKTNGNLTAKETQLLNNALFELRMGFLEVTQALARSAANRAPGGPGGFGGPGAPGGISGGPSIVR